MRMETTDEDLALSAATGDRAAFAALATRVYDRVLRLAWRLTGNQAEAEDLTQDVLMTLPAKLRSFRAEARLTTWLYRVVINAAHDRRRRAVAHGRAADGWGDWEIARQAAACESAEARDWVTTAMAQLPPGLRDTLALVLDGETHAQVAEVLGVSEGTVSWRMSEVKKHLRNLQEAEA